jgi:hypothetical protein
MAVTTTALDAALLLGHAAATLAMAGVIWFVQVVHYPLFAAVAPERFAGYESGHRRLTTVVVAPLMLVELATAVALVIRPAAAAEPRWAVWAGLALLAVIWSSTFFVQVPLHEKLAAGFDGAAHRRLVRGNWVRTAGWTARAGLALLLL